MGPVIRWIKAQLAKLRPYAKAAVGGAIGTATPLLIAGFASGWNWKAVLGAAVTGAATALGVYRVPNRVKR
jgi:hypothetical protein